LSRVAKIGFKVFRWHFVLQWFLLALFRGFGFVRGWLCKVSQIGLSFLGIRFGKSKSHHFSASVLVSIKYSLVSAVVSVQNKVRSFSASVSVYIKYFGSGQK
jgi:cell shape-determining protein MreC